MCEGAARDGRRVRRQHELDPQIGERRMEPFRAGPRRKQVWQQFVERAGLRLAAGALILPPPPDPVVLFRDVRQRQEVRKGPGDGDREGHGQRPQQGRQLFELEHLAGSRSLRQRANTFYELEQLPPGALPQGGPEHLAKRPHIIA